MLLSYSLAVPIGQAEPTESAAARRSSAATSCCSPMASRASRWAASSVSWLSCSLLGHLLRGHRQRHICLGLPARVGRQPGQRIIATPTVVAMFPFRYLRRLRDPLAVRQPPDRHSRHGIGLVAAIVLASASLGR